MCLAELGISSDRNDVRCCLIWTLCVLWAPRVSLRIASRPKPLSLSHSSSRSSCNCFAIKSAESSKQLLLRGDSQTPAERLGNYLGADLLEEEKATGISIPSFPTPSHSRGSAQSRLARAGAVLPQNTVSKETSPPYRQIR